MVSSPLVRRLIHLAIDEDLSFDDVTTALTIPESSVGAAEIVAKQNLVVCGLPIVPMVFDALDAEVTIEMGKQDGDEAKAGDKLVELRGHVRTLLSAERMILNFLQRLSGVATLTRTFVKAAEQLVVLDTRKTLPGWRMLDKYAVGIGGARNHRFHLGDMVLVKNNHVDAMRADSPRERMHLVLTKVFAKKPMWMPVEVEVRSLEELEEALNFKPQMVMLDNMPDQTLQDALARIRSCGSDTQVEVSGGVSLDRLAHLAKMGVSCVSVGALTTQASNVDISMRLLT